jgi:nucleoside phosphorylase
VREEKAERHAIIVTALPLESAAVRRYLSNVRYLRHPQGNLYECGEFLAAEQPWQIILVETGPGNRASAQQTERALTFFRERPITVALLVGIAGGLKDVGLGDVVFASVVYDYEGGKEAEHFQPRVRTYQASPFWQDRARILAASDERLNYVRQQPAQRPKLLIAPLACGEKVIASRASATYQLLRQYCSDAVAVAMEDAGFMLAAQQGGVAALVIRGISDLIDRKSETDAQGYQELAADNAAACAFALLALESRSDVPAAAVSLPAATPPSAAKEPPAPLEAFLVRLPLYLRQLEQADQVLRSSEPIYKDQCQRFSEQLRQLQTAVEQVNLPANSDQLVRMRLQNLNATLQDLQVELRAFRQCCPPGSSPQEQRTYEKKRSQVQGLIADLIERVKLLQSAFDS